VRHVGERLIKPSCRNEVIIKASPKGGMFINFFGVFKMKAKQNNTANNAVTIKNEKDAAYQFAVLRDSGRSIVQWILEKHPDFADNVSDTLKAQLYEGLTTRYHENNGENVFIQGDTGTLIPIGNTVKGVACNGKFMPKVEKMPEGAVAYGIHHVLAYTPQQLGMMKSKEPALHSILSPINSSFRKYASNTVGDMQKMAKKIIDEKEGKTQTREMLLFIDSMTKQFDAWDKQVKNAEKRLDDTASSVRYRVARDAFFKAYNAK